MRRFAILFTLLSLLVTGELQGQPVLEKIKKDPSYASCNYSLYPDSIPDNLTPAPAGKRPFYISYYGRHGSRYISNRTGFDIPYRMIQHARAVDELTPEGKRVFEEMDMVMKDTEDRWGELTPLGSRQCREISRRMMQRFPEVFEGAARVQAKSTGASRCMASMGYAMMEMAQRNPQLQITMETSMRDMDYMNHQDARSRTEYMTPEAKKAFDEFVNPRMGNSRLMEQIFKNPDIVKELVDESHFNYYLMKMGLFVLHTRLSDHTYLKDLFLPEELYRMWQVDNALWYIQHGACKLNGGHQPFTQRNLLRRIVTDTDSCLQFARPGAQLRFGHDTVILPLVCLMGINGYDLATSRLEDLEAKGWWCSTIFPMAGNVQFIFYRSDPKDQDVLVKVLLNEQEASLPIATDCAPYYHWTDVRRYCIEKAEQQ